MRFTVLGTPQPQGSIRVFMIGGKPRLTSANPLMHSWRQEVGMAALRERPADEIYAARHIPVRAEFSFTIEPPKKKRLFPSVKPDIDKLCRAVNDALTGVLWVDDGQVVEMVARKIYGSPAKTEISVEML